MSRDERRGKTGWWLIALVGLFLTAIGIRYASSTDWWANTFYRQRQTYQTVNTGVSVQMVSASGGRTPVGENYDPPPIRDPEPSPTPRQQGRRMW